MTAPLDEKALSVAAVVLMQSPDGSAGKEMPEQTYRRWAEATIRAYLEAPPSPSEMEVVAWLYECTAGPYKGEVDVHSRDGVGGSEAMRAANFYTEPFAVVRLDEAQSAIAAMRAERDEAQQELKVHELSFSLRWKSDMRASERWQAATGRTMTLPDHTDLSVWLFSQLEAAEARIKALEEALTKPDAERRQWFIGDTLNRQGFINRADLVANFAISVPQASTDIQKWLSANPGQATYNSSSKRYETAARTTLLKGQADG